MQLYAAQNMNKQKNKNGSGHSARVKHTNKKEQRNIVNWDWILELNKKIDGKHVKILPDADEVRKSMETHYNIMFPHEEKF